jgi:hypothetical protein
VLSELLPHADPKTKTLSFLATTAAGARQPAPTAVPAEDADPAIAHLVGVLHSAQVQQLGREAGQAFGQGQPMPTPIMNASMGSRSMGMTPMPASPATASGMSISTGIPELDASVQQILQKKRLREAGAGAGSGATALNLSGYMGTPLHANPTNPVGAFNQAAAMPPTSAAIPLSPLSAQAPAVPGANRIAPGGDKEVVHFQLLQQQREAMAQRLASQLPGAFSMSGSIRAASAMTSAPAQQEASNAMQPMPMLSQVARVRSQSPRSVQFSFDSQLSQGPHSLEDPSARSFAYPAHAAAMQELPLKVPVSGPVWRQKLKVSFADESGLYDEQGMPLASSSSSASASDHPLASIPEDARAMAASSVSSLREAATGCPALLLSYNVELLFGTQSDLAAEAVAGTFAGPVPPGSSGHYGGNNNDYLDSNGGPFAPAATANAVPVAPVAPQGLLPVARALMLLPDAQASYVVEHAESAPLQGIHPSLASAVPHTSTGLPLPRLALASGPLAVHFRAMDAGRCGSGSGVDLQVIRSEMGPSSSSSSGGGSQAAIPLCGVTAIEVLPSVPSATAGSPNRSPHGSDMGSAVAQFWPHALRVTAQVARPLPGTFGSNLSTSSTNNGELYSALRGLPQAPPSATHLIAVVTMVLALESRKDRDMWAVSLPLMRSLVPAPSFALARVPLLPVPAAAMAAAHAQLQAQEAQMSAAAAAAASTAHASPSRQRLSYFSSSPLASSPAAAPYAMSAPGSISAAAASRFASASAAGIGGAGSGPLVVRLATVRR